MKTLFNILYAIFILFILSVGVHLFEYLSVIARSAHDLVFVDQLKIDSNLDITIAFLNSVLAIYILIHFLKFIKVLKRISEKVLFSKENGKAFFKIGRALVYYSLLKFVVGFINFISTSVLHEDLHPYKIGVALGEQIRFRIPLLGIAMFLLIIAKLMKDGYELKNENDLTI
ncbi:MAG: DUF2975 domain-containing protein [Flavobacteriaceae bacterium]|nr:DUF2975 domain-containing protein [Flavobacteriaceae bacterium]